MRFLFMPLFLFSAHAHAALFINGEGHLHLVTATGEDKHVADAGAWRSF